MFSFNSFSVRILFAVAAAVLLLAGCSGREGGTSAPSQTDQPVVTDQPAGFNANDIAFARSVIAFGQHSVELAALVPERSTNPEIVSAASNFGALQSADVELLKVFLVQWSAGPVDGTIQDGQASGTAGMVDDATLARLQSSNGREFDTLWLQTVIGHVQGSLELAEAEVAEGSNVDALATAKRMVDAQQALIGQLRQLLPTG